MAARVKMFNLDSSPKDRYNEYLLLGTITKKTKSNGTRVMGIFLDKDTRQLISLYKARRAKLYAEMKADCYRCFGTGIPSAHQEDSIFESTWCPNCNRSLN